MTRICKVNHAFMPTANCAYTYLYSPRFGPVVAVTTVRQVVFDFIRPGLALELLALLLVLKIMLMKALAITVIQVVFGFCHTRV